MKTHVSPRLRQGFTLTELMIVVGLIGMISAIAATSVLRARDHAATTLCISNLQQIMRSKAIWAYEHKAANTDVPPENELAGPGQYLKHWPVCPRGGTYSANDLVTPPTCDQPKHVIP